MDLQDGKCAKFEAGVISETAPDWWGTNRRDAERPRRANEVAGEVAGEVDDESCFDRTSVEGETGREKPDLSEKGRCL